MGDIFDNFMGLFIFRANIVGIKVGNEEINITSAEGAAHLFLLFAVPKLHKTVTAKNMSTIRLDFLFNITVADCAVLGVNLGSDANFLECGV